MRLSVKILLAASALVAGGCGGREWKSDDEELKYLQSVANPTPEQWKRRRALDVDPKTGENREDQKKWHDSVRKLTQPRDD